MRRMLGMPDMPILSGEDARLTVAEAIRENTWGAVYGTATAFDCLRCSAGYREATLTGHPTGKPDAR